MTLRLICVLLFASLVGACTTTNEITGRKQLNFYSAEQGAALGASAFAEVQKTAPVLQRGPMVDRVERLGARIAAVSHAPDMDWEFVVIDEDVLNAWALPGGKVAFYTKMLDLFPNDDQLAAIMGHEIAHAVLRHGAERMSRAQLQQMAILGVGVAAGAVTDDSDTARLAVALGSLAAQGFVALPHSRFTELEADDVGALYMARAGYDPRGAVDVWETMATQKDGSVPEFLSTHPDDGRRAERLNAKMDCYLYVFRTRDMTELCNDRSR